MRGTTRRTRLLLLAAILTLAPILACGPLTGEDESPTPTFQVSEEEEPEATNTPENEEAPEEDEETEEPEEEGEGEDPTETTEPADDEFCLDGQYIADITIPDGSTIGPDEHFDKTWRLQNTGCDDWPAGTKLTFVQGDLLSGPASVDVPVTAVNGMQDVTVSLIGPTIGGTYRGYWQLKSPSGIYFGPKIYVDILIPDVGLPPGGDDMPDLVVQSIEPTGLLLPSTPITFDITIKNQGGASSGSSQAGVSLSGGGAGILITVPAIPAGGTATVQKEYTLLEGDYTLQVIADTTAIINEADEGNNLRQYNFTVAPLMLMPPLVTFIPILLPDLVIANVAFLNNQSNMQIIVNNEGLGDSIATTVYCSAEDPGGSGDGDTSTLPAISAGGHIVMTCLTPPSGTVIAAYYVELDPDNNVIETDETNNIWAVN